jgi:DHA2 family multidrug resistance protein
MVNTLVARHAQIHRADLAQNLSQGNPAFQQTFQGIKGAMAQQAQPNVAIQRAYGLIQNTLDAQSSAFSYVDVFRYIALACFGCGLIVFFMQRVRAKKGATALVH